MLQGKLVRLRSVTREDLPRLWAFNNDLEVELAGGGDPPLPQSLARLQAEFDSDLRGVDAMARISPSKPMTSVLVSAPCST